MSKTRVNYSDQKIRRIIAVIKPFLIYKSILASKMSFNNGTGITKMDSADTSKHQSSKLVTFATNQQKSKMNAIDEMIKAQNSLKGSAKFLNVSIPLNKYI